MRSLADRNNSRNWIILVFLWTVVTFVNLNKAFHIDDTFHLESAQWIAKHPLSPMSGDVIWYDNPEKFHHHNQPALLFYLITITGEIFGYSEIPLHLLLSIFTFLALFFFLKILDLFSAPSKGMMMTLFALCPAFIVNQNLMTDIPILAMEMAFFYYLFRAEKYDKPSQYIQAGLALGCALLIKYSMIPLVLVMGIAILMSKHYKYLFSLLIPIGILGLWSIFNKIEYGGIHLMDRPKNELTLVKVFDQLKVFAGCIGAVAPFSLALLYGAIRKKPLIYLNYFIPVCFIIFAFLVYQGVIPELNSTRWLNPLFMVNGAIIIILLLSEMMHAVIDMRNASRLFRRDIILYLWILSMSGFMILYAPFMALRHILLILPCILLISIRLFERAERKLKVLAVAATAALGLLLGISDWKYADFYRRMANEIELPEGARVWSSGHWGWQWYTAKRGMMTYSTDSAKVRNGDYIVYPVDMSRQKINDRIRLTEVKRIWEPADITTFFSGNDFASLYNSYTYKGSWELSMKPVDTIIIGKIQIIEDSDTSSVKP
jgi:hypothetical protein